MKIKLLQKKKDKLSFLLEDTTPAFANALRRIMISEVPVLAIEWVDFHDNTSVTYDEFIAHRLGLLPLRFDPGKINFTEDCKCGGTGCVLCQVVFALDKTGPCIAYSGDMKSSNSEVKPTDPGFPITSLLKNHSIKLEAIARLGIGLNHMKYQAANASYQYFPELGVTDKKNIKEAISSCPKGILRVSGGNLALSDPTKCDICRACEADGIEIKGNENKFIFNVESVSGLDPGYIVMKAAEILTRKGEEFRKLVDNA